MQKFHALCSDVETVTGIKTVLFDADRRVVYACPNTMCDFCERVRTSPELTEQCLACDRAAFRACDGGEEIHVYRCHMGLVEAVSPVEVDGKRVGYLMFGQILPAGGRSEVESRIASLPDPDLRRDLSRHLAALPETDAPRIRAAARILAMCAAYVRQTELLPVGKRENLPARLSAYIDAHLDDPDLTVAAICAALGASRTALFNAAKETYGMGVGELLRTRRANKAVRLLCQSEKTNAEISRAVGVREPDGLYKLLLRTVGKSPREIRKEAKSSSTEPTDSQPK